MQRGWNKALIWGLLFLFVVGTGAMGGMVAAYVRDLPPLDPLEEYQPSLVTTLYDDEGQPFAAFFEQKRILVPLSKVPRFLVEALIAVEDSRFYQHHGLDPVGIARAFFSNVKCLCLAEGGSTITQQLAKVLFLTPEKSLTRKLSTLENETVLCPGHNYAHVPTARLAEEKCTNPFLNARTLQDFLRLAG